MRPVACRSGPESSCSSFLFTLALLHNLGACTILQSPAKPRTQLDLTGCVPDPDHRWQKASPNAAATMAHALPVSEKNEVKGFELLCGHAGLLDCHWRAAQC